MVRLQTVWWRVLAVSALCILVCSSLDIYCILYMLFINVVHVEALLYDLCCCTHSEFHWLYTSMCIECELHQSS